MRKWLTVALAAVIAGCNGSFGQMPGNAGTIANGVRGRSGSSPIQHIVIVMQENRSFDNLFHGFPGADTVNTGMGHGKKYTLKSVPLTFPFDLNHSHTQFLEDYDQGKGDGFDGQVGPQWSTHCPYPDPINHPACWVISKNPKIMQYPFSYVNEKWIEPYWTMAEQYALGDKTFSSNNGPTFVSHQYLIAGQAAHSSEVPNTEPWSCSSPNNTVYHLEYGQADPPEFSKATGFEVDDGLHPCFTYQTIADLLDSAHISWRYYVQANGSGTNLSAFQAIQQVYMGKDWTNVVSPDTQVLKDISAGTLANVSWVMPSGQKSDHPGPQSGDKGPAWVASIVNAVGESQYWNSTAVIVMWDEWGGWYDHVHPPQYPDPQTHAREGLGFRVPLIIVSPYAKAGFISHKQHEIASTLSFIEQTFGLGKLGAGSGFTYADSRADAFDDMFDYTQAPIPFKKIPVKQNAEYFLTHPDNTPGDTY